ncbi:MAG: TlpA disulfide reductase family protein [Desulfuromonadaceae bacterium]
MLGFVFFLSQLGVSAAGWALEVGSTPPDFQLQTLDGKSFQLSEHRGELLILKLGTTWCPSCRQQEMDLNEAAAFLKENQIRLVEVFLQDTEAMARETLAASRLESPVDAMLDDGQVQKAYNIYLIPRVILVDREFRVLSDGANLTAEQIKKGFGGQ